MIHRADVQKAVNEFEGVLRLEPSWVPRSFMIPGRRLKLHSDDLYAFGAHRGGINERWFSSTTKASNGPATTADEGLSYVHPGAGAKFLLKDAVEVAGDLVLGADVMEREGGWIGAVIVDIDLGNGIGRARAIGFEKLFGLTFELLEIGVVSQDASGVHA